MRPPKRRWTALLGGVLVLARAGSAFGQLVKPLTGGAGDVVPRPAAFGESRSSYSLDSGADAEVGGAGTVDSALVRDARAAQENFFRTFNNGIIRTPRLGYGQGSLSIAAPLGASANFSPFAFSERSEDVEIKLGRLYLDLGTLGLTFLYRDNSRLTEVGQQPEPTLAMRLEGRLIYQLNDVMQLSMAGSVFWLPLKDEVTLSDPLASYTGTFAPAMQTRFIYDLPFNHFDVVFLDTLAAQSTGLGTSAEAFELLSRRSDDPLLRDTRAQGPTDRRAPTALAYRNSVGGNISSLLPTVTRATLGYVHENVWQSGGPGQASSSDTFSAELKSERENMRFKPFFNYSAKHQNNKFGYDTVSRGGFDGPLTDYLDLHSEVGYFLTGDEKGEGYTWGVALTHRPRQQIEHRLSYGRSVTYPDRSLGTAIIYTARWLASPDLLVEAAAQEVNTEPIDNPNNSFGGKQFQTEGRFSYRLGRRVTTQFGYAWAHAVARTSATRFDTHTFRFKITMDHTPKLQSALILSHESRDSNQPLDSYEENVVALTLNRTF